MSFDIETVIDNTWTGKFVGNSRPVVLTAFGYAYFDSEIRRRNDPEFSYNSQKDRRV